VHQDLGDYAKALLFQEKSLKIKEEIGDRRGIAISLNNLGNLHWNLGDYARALAFYERSLKIQEEIGDRDGEALTLANLCDTRFGPAAERVPYGERALALAEEIGSPERIYGSHAALGKVYAAALSPVSPPPPGEGTEGAGEKSLFHFRAAIEAAEGLRAMLTESGQKSGFLGTKLETYEGLVEALLKQPVQGSPLKVHGQSVNREPGTVNQNDEAFSVAERMRARSFLDEMGAARFLREGAPPELMEQKRLLEARMKWLAEKTAK
jgi:tetratricopeptide (TPR) repeat protein